MKYKIIKKQIIKDAALNEWPATISSLLNKFPDVETVIPGHGQTGGIELLQHTLKLLDEQ